MLTFDIKKDQPVLKMIDDLQDGATFIYNAAYEASGLDLDSTLVYMKVFDEENGNAAVELNYKGRLANIDYSEKLIEVELTVTGLKFK